MYGSYFNPRSDQRPRQRLEGAGVQINCRLGSEVALAYPAQQAFPVNVGHALVFVFVWHRRTPSPGFGVAGPRGRVDFEPWPCGAAAPHCGLETKSFLGLVEHNDLESCSFCLKPFNERTLAAYDRLPARPPVRTDSTLGLSL